MKNSCENKFNVWEYGKKKQDEQRSTRYSHAMKKKTYSKQCKFSLKNSSLYNFARWIYSNEGNASIFGLYVHLMLYIRSQRVNVRTNNNEVRAYLQKISAARHVRELKAHLLWFNNKWLNLLRPIWLHHFAQNKNLIQKAHHHMFVVFRPIIFSSNFQRLILIRINHKENVPQWRKKTNASKKANNPHLV